jgi:hypothetical protein
MRVAEEVAGLLQTQQTRAKTKGAAAERLKIHMILIITA